jgi:spermidine synthase
MINSFRIRSLFFFIFLSGLAGLGYEIVWTRMFSLALGHEILAVLAVVAAFFSGLALGAYGLDGLVSRSRFPGRWYALFELIIGGWSLALISLIPAANHIASTLIGLDPSPFRQWSVAFGLPFLVLLPATAAMGGTLPAMERLVSRLRRDGWSVGGLYAANTLGAVVGTLGSTLLLVPAVGLTVTLAVLALVNFLCAAGVYLGAARDEGRLARVRVEVPGLPSRRRLLSAVFATGLFGIGYEVVIIRAISQVLENTVYTFAAVLSVYLLATALGAALYQRFAPRTGFPEVLRGLLLATSVACLAGVALLWATDTLYAGVRTGLGGGFAGSIAGELAVAFAVFFLPATAMGAAFSHLAQGARDRDGFGVALGVNTIGAAMAPLVFGILLLPALGSKLVLVGLSLGYVLLAPGRPSPRRLAATALPGGVALALLLAPAQLRFVTVPPGGSLIEHREGVMAAVSVVRDARDELYLKVNDHFRMGGTASSYSDRRQAHISLLLHPEPRRALFLGIGSGVTFAAAADYRDLEADGVELVPEIIPLLPHFAKSNGAALDNERLRMRVADARRFVNATDEAYDVIIADLFHPARDGAGSLYTVEHFRAVRSRLADTGIFCQWLPLYQLDLQTLRSIVRTFLQVFPQGSAYLAHYSLQTPILGLVSSGPPGGYTHAWLDRRLEDGALARALASLRLDSPYALFGGYLAGSRELGAFAAAAPLNTDDRPLVVFEAPRFAYAGEEPAHVRLLALVDRFEPTPGELLKAASTPGEREAHWRLARYWQARNRFLHLGVGVTEAGDVLGMLRRVREPLLDLVRLSPDFDAAYSPLLVMARELRRVDAGSTRSLLLALAEANPQRPEAARLLDLLF